jgi:type F conjugative transfer system protein TrbI
MNMRDFGKWLASNPGKLIIALATIGFLLCIIFTFNRPGSPPPERKAKTPELNERVMQKDYNLGPAMQSAEFQEKVATQPTPTLPMPYRELAKEEEEKQTFRPLRFGSVPAEKPQPATQQAKPLEAKSTKKERDVAESAPYGRLLKCHLCNTVESCNLETPVIGLVDEDFWWGKKLLIPANTEMHGVATGEKVRDRIGCDTHWIAVIYEPRKYNRRELQIQGVALDRDKAPTTNPADLDLFAHYGLTDGSAGLRGDIVVLDIKQQLKNKAELFASAFLSSFAQNFQTTAQTVYGFQPTPTLKNAALGGSAGVMSEYADELRKKIEADSEYVRVTAGKQFYVYVQQTLDMDEAKEGLMLPPDQRANGFGEGADQIYRRLYQRKEDLRQEELGPYAGINNAQEQMKALQVQISKLQLPGLPIVPNNQVPQYQQPNTEQISVQGGGNQ